MTALPYSCRRLMHPGRDAAPQRGQALSEGLLALMVLLLVWLSVAWLGRYQDILLQADHASRFAAFALTRDPEARPVDGVHGFFSGAGAVWRDVRGQGLFDRLHSGVSLAVGRNAVLPRTAQVGAPSTDALLMRQDWGIEDSGVLVATVSVAPGVSMAEGKSGSRASRLLRFDDPYPPAHRSTAILEGAGHASGDAQAQERVANSLTAWGRATELSQARGREIAQHAAPVDAAWSRPKPSFDWLQPWRGMVPNHHRVDGGLQ